MRKIKIKSSINEFQVSDIKKSLEWYKKWLGEPDVIPMENIAEYELTKNSWLQLYCSDEDKKGQGSIVLGVEDINLTKNILEDSKIATGDILDYEVVLLFDIFDLDGNKITFVQEI